MEIRKVTDPSFGVYGKVLKGYGFDRMLKEMGHTPVPDDGVIYMASVEELEGLPVAAKLKERAYGGLPIQIGYCNGNNHKLNALEYHRSSEIDIAASDLILLLGRQQDIEADYTYDTERAQAYYVPAGRRWNYMPRRFIMRLVQRREMGLDASSYCRKIPIQTWALSWKGWRGPASGGQEQMLIAIRRPRSKVLSAG